MYVLTDNKCVCDLLVNFDNNDGKVTKKIKCIFLMQTCLDDMHTRIPSSTQQIDAN